MSDLSTCRVLLFQETGGPHSYILNNLRACGLRDVTGVDDLASAIDHIIARRFDLIMVTHFGQATDASRLLEEIKSHEATCDIPVMAVAKKGSVKDVLRILAKGVDEVMVEPMSQQEVEAKLRKVLHQSSGRDLDREQLGQAAGLAQKGMLDEAEVIYSDFVLDPRLGFLANLGLFEIYLQKGDWAAAGRVLKEASDMAKATPDEVELQRRMSSVFFHYGRYYEARKQPKKAVKSYRTALKLDPFNLANMVALLHQLQREDDLESTLEVIREAGVSFLPYSQAMEDIATAVSDICDRYRSLGLTDEAGRLYAELAEVRHEAVDVHLKVTDFFVKADQPHLVVRGLMDTCQRIKDAELLERLGSILLENPQVLARAKVMEIPGMGQASKADPGERALAVAKQVYHQAMLLEPDNPAHRLNLATCELRLGNDEAAAEVLNRVKENDFQNLEVYTQIIGTLLEESALELAGQWIKDASVAFGDHPRVAGFQASLFRQQGQDHKAITALKKGLKVSPEELDLLKALGETYLDGGDRSEAAFYLEKAFKLAPDDEEVRELLARAT